EERRLAGVRKSDEGGIGEELQTKLDLPFLARQADLREARRLSARPGEVLVAAAARTSLPDDYARTPVREIGDELFPREDLGSDRDGEHGVLAARTVREAAASDSTSPGPKLLIRAEAGEVSAARVGRQYDVASVPTVPTVRTAARHVFLAPEVDGAVTAFAGD